MALLLLLSCTSDACRLLCADVAVALNGCLDEWGATWEDFDVSTQNAFGNRCRAEWDGERTELEPRQLDAATGECADVQAALPGMSCDELRALYFDP